jgi:pimeloyl-ACP methyl ester carboxylesterase
VDRECGDHLVTLPDGRTLGYAIYGDPTGQPVVNCHGGLVSGHDVGPAHELARALGMCIVSPDRPGIGRTDRLPGHGLLQWVHTDLVPLLDRLEVGQLGVMGWSEGGQYALAVAFELRERVTGCAVIADCLPLDDPATFNQFNRLDRAYARLARRAPLALRSLSACTWALSKSAPGVLQRISMRGAPGGEAQAVRAQQHWLPTILGEGVADPRGVVDEYLAMVAPWGFLPEEVTAPVHVYQGTADALVPEAWGSLLSERLPHASLTLYPGEGHFIALTRRREVLEWLATTKNAPGGQ